MADSDGNDTTCVIGGVEQEIQIAMTRHNREVEIFFIIAFVLGRSLPQLAEAGYPTDVNFDSGREKLVQRVRLVREAPPLHNFAVFNPHEVAAAQVNGFAFPFTLQTESGHDEVSIDHHIFQGEIPTCQGSHQRGH